MVNGRFPSEKKDWETSGSINTEDILTWMRKQVHFVYKQNVHFFDNTTFYLTSERKKIMKLSSEFVFFFLKKLLGRENSVPIFSIYIIWKVFQISFWKLNVEFFLIICNSLCITNDDTNERCFIKCTINNVLHVSLIWILHRHNFFYW